MLKPTFLCAAALAAVFSTAPTTGEDARLRADGQRFQIDPSHSTVLFRVQHLKSAPFYGRFNEISGEFTIDSEDPENSSLQVTIPVASIDSNNGKRDEHLRSSDFFSAKEFDTITLRSTSVEKASEESYRVTGELTLRGETRELVFVVNHTGTAELSPNFGLRSGYETTFTIDRTDYGMDYYAEQGVLGKDVQITVAIEGMIPR
ncbi:MAG: YceI family protein [Planctomycetota bacterium]